MAIEPDKEIRTNGQQQDDADGANGADGKGHESNKHNHKPDQDPAAGGEQQQQRAASLLQEKYRGYRSRREALGLNLQLPNNDKGKGRASNEEDTQDQEQDKNSPLSPNTRWNDALSSGGLQRMNSEQLANKNDPKSRWQRTGFYAERINGTDGRQMKGVQKGEEGQSNQQKAAALAPNKQMEAQYWLELVDSKHRYGTNLKSYHDTWNKSNTKHNFFYWLDNGSGKDLDLPDCPREQLDRERVTYLSAEQRRNYLVDVGKDGLLYWHRNGRRLDTAKGKWEDLGNGRGVGYKGEKDHLPPLQPSNDDDASSSSSSSASSLYSSSDSEAEHEHPDQYKQKHYKQQPDNGESKRHYFTSPKMIMDVLLRKTINSNTWIYVSDTSGRLFVGIKSTGGFQHSSFMYGATVASAGLLKVKNGQLTSLSPLSGHYRAGTAHFKAFHKSLQERGVDMSRVSTSKSLFVIRGIEKYGRFSKKKKELKTRIRHKLHMGPNKEEEKQEEDKERNKEIERSAQKDSNEQSPAPPAHTRRDSDNSSSSSGESDSDSDDGSNDTIAPDMHDDLKKEEMTDQQRAERAVALIRRAMSKGLKGEEKEVEKGGEDGKAGGDKDTSSKAASEQKQRNGKDE